MKRWRWLGVLFLLGLLAAQMAGSSVHKSAAFDEPYHLAAGYAYLFLLVTLLYRPPDRRQLPLGQRATALTGIGLLALVVMWATYRFEIGPVGEIGVPLPLPTYWQGMAAVYRRVQAGTFTFLLGRTHDTGWWYYFPVVFALKTPLPTLILLGLGLVSALHPSTKFRQAQPSGSGHRRWRQAVLWLVPAAVIFAAIASPLNIGYRHVLPVLPFVIALSAAYGLSFRPLPAFRRVLAGPEFFGYNPYTPPPGIYAISTTSLQLGLLYQHRDLYAIFRDREPDARIGYSMHIYDLAYPSDAPLDRAVVVGPAVADLPPERLGLQPGHRLIAKWAGPGAFVLAAGGPAHYLVEATMPASSVVEILLADGGSFADARPLLETLPGDPTPTILRHTQDTVPDGEPVPLPASFDGGPALAGYELAGTTIAPGQTVELVTYWRMGETIEPSLAVFVHLLDADGNILSQWDGWPVAMSGLEAGDVIVLSHPLPVPEGTPACTCTLQLGLYRPPDGPRLLVAGADWLLFPPAEVDVP